MRYRFAQALEKIAKKDKKTVFLTGDLGFGVFDNLRSILKDRFINAGVAEHNMATTAAGLAYAGFKPWIYSIAPFVSIKILEELRNDICNHNFNVKIVGLGGGFDYEVAGPSHHATEDVGILLTLPHMKVYAPAFGEDVEPMVYAMYENHGPEYIRLTKDRKIPFKNGRWVPWRNLYPGTDVTVIVLGSIMDKVIEAMGKIGRNGLFDIWSVTCLPSSLPANLVASLKKTQKVCVIEEHVTSGGLGQWVSTQLHTRGIAVKAFIHRSVTKHFHETGSRDYYLQRNGLDAEHIRKILKRLINER